MSRSHLLLLAAFLGLSLACEAGGATPAETETSTVSAPPTARITAWSPYATGTVAPTAEQPIGPPSKREWVPRGYAEGTYNRVVPPNLAAAVEEGRRYARPSVPAQLSEQSSTTEPECIASTSSTTRAGDWLVDLARFEGEGVLLLTPTYVEEVTDHFLLRARHLASGAEHFYEARHYALFDSDRELAPGEPRAYEAFPEFPNAGEWLVVLTHGPNWGCVTLEVPASITRPFAFDIAAVEAAGKTFPRREGVPDRVHPAFRNPENRGTSERSCLAIAPGDFSENEQGAVSGEWSIQGWPGYFSTWVPNRQGKLPMVPYWQDEMRPPTIRAVRIGDPATTLILQDSEGWSFGGDGKPGNLFFPSPLVFPHEGTWLMAVESAPNWGCYQVEFIAGVSRRFR